jgi:TPR repeat protein
MLRRFVVAVPTAMHQHKVRGTVYESHRVCQYYNYQRSEALSLYSYILNMFTLREEHMIDVDKLKALDDLKAALAELSVASDEEPSIYYDHDQLLELSVKPIDTLTTDQLEELGRAYYNGIDSVIEVNLERSFTLWSEAASRGSVDSKYVSAVCLRDGSGVAKDLERAFKEMLSVADDHSYAMAHVSLSLHHQLIDNI